MDFPYALGQPLLVRSPYQLPKGFDSWRGNCENPFLEILHQLYTLEVFSKLLSLNSEKVLISSLCGRDMACISLHVFSFFIVHVINSCYALSAPGPAFEELNFFFFSFSAIVFPLLKMYLEIQSEEFNLLDSAEFFGIFLPLGQKPQAKDLILMVKKL